MRLPPWSGSNNWDSRWQDLFTQSRIAIVYNYKAKKSLRFLVSARVVSEPRVDIFYFILFCHETMSNCSQNCWNDWNFAVLRFRRLFTLYGKFGQVPKTYTCITYFTGWQKKLVITPILKPTHDQKPDTYFGLSCYKNMYLYLHSPKFEWLCSIKKAFLYNIYW